MHVQPIQSFNKTHMTFSRTGNKVNFYTNLFKRYNMTNMTKFPIVEDKKSYKILFNKPLDITHLKLDSHPTKGEIIALTDYILEQNPGKSLNELFFKKFWDIKSFNEKNLPVVLGQLEDIQSFSKRFGERYFPFMDMPIYMPRKGWMIPEELSQFSEVIKRAMDFEKMINPNLSNCFVYLTVDQRPVAPKESQRRTGYHADSYINIETRLNLEKTTCLETDSIYLVSDCIPTQYCEGPFPFEELNPNDTEAVLDHFEKIGKEKPIHTFPSYTLVRMGPECVHRVGINESDETMDRTFLKITVSSEVFNRQGNGHNALFDYNWPMIPRSDTKRNHANSVFEPAKLKGVEYEMVYEMMLQEMFKQNVHSARKIAFVDAYLATEGELLQTTDGTFTTTVQIANRGNWKVRTETGSEYFLPGASFENLYRPMRNGRFESKPEIITFKPLDKHIKIKAPWGRVQYGRPGDVLIKRKDGTIYIVLRKDFDAWKFSDINYKSDNRE